MALKAVIVYFAATNSKFYNTMAFVTNTIQEAPTAEVTTNQSSEITTGEASLILGGALAAATLTKASRKQYRKMVRKATWKMAKLKVASLFGGKSSVPDEVMGLNFWVFVGIVALAAIVGTAVFGLTGFLALLGIAIIIYLLTSE